MRLAVACLALAVSLGAQQPVRKAADRPAPQGAGERVADAWLRAMTLRQKIAQLVVIRTHGRAGNVRGREWRNILHWVRDTGVGGIVVVNRTHRGAVVRADPYETLRFVNSLQRVAKTPMLVAGDFERSVSMRFDGPVQYPHAMAYAAAGNTVWTSELGRITASESRTLGFQWVFAPDADVNVNPDNPIVGIRSFGVDAETAAAHVRAFISGAQSYSPRVLTTAKHYPGHGDTDIDSHYGLPVLASDRDRLRAVDLLPFRAAISSGVDSVMSAHVALPQVDSSGVPATISKTLIGEVLRGELGFDGLAVTDAMDMDGLAKEYGSAEAAVKALEAGVDVLLMPRDPDQAIAAVLRAVNEQRLSVGRIDASVKKILRAKVKVQLHQSRLTGAEGIKKLLANKEGQQHAQRVADAAIALLRGDRTLLPLKNDASTCIVAMADRAGNDQGLQLKTEIHARAPAVRFTIVNPQNADADLEGCRTVTLAPFLAFGQWKQEFTPLMERVARSGSPWIIAALGNPFLTRAFPGAALALATYSTVPVSETALAKVLLGEINPMGKAFVTFQK